MSYLRYQLVYTLFVLCAVLFASCSSPTEEIPRKDMIQPGDKVGETVFRQAVDASEMRPLLPELCDWVELAELSEQLTHECVITYEPTIFLSRGLMESDQEKRNEIWQNLTWELTINGQPVDLEAFGTTEAVGGLWWNILLENPTSDPLELKTVVTIHNDPIEKLGKTTILSVTSKEREDPILLTPSPEAGQHAYHSEKAGLDYLLFVPDHYQANPEQQFPLILYFHGAFSGTDVNVLRQESLPKKLESGSNFPSLVVSPHVVGEYEFWAEEETMAAVHVLLQEIEANLNVDPERIYLTGFSAGGNGTWAMGLDDPDRFAALVPVAGYYGYPFTLPENICDLQDVPVWAFHGGKDENVPLDAEQQIFDALQKCGGDVQFTIYPDDGHDIEDLVYGNPDLYSWLLSKKLE